MNNNIDANDLSDQFLNRAAEVPGAYEVNGQVYMVKFNQSKTNLYAKIRQGASWVYAPGAIYRIGARHLMTVARCEEVSANIGSCCICGRTLTVKESVAAGIGPVCRKRQGFAWAS